MRKKGHFYYTPTSMVDQPAKLQLISANSFEINADTGFNINFLQLWELVLKILKESDVLRPGDI